MCYAFVGMRESGRGEYCFTNVLTEVQYLALVLESLEAGLAKVQCTCSGCQQRVCMMCGRQLCCCIVPTQQDARGRLRERHLQAAAMMYLLQPGAKLASARA